MVHNTLAFVQQLTFDMLDFPPANLERFLFSALHTPLAVFDLFFSPFLSVHLPVCSSLAVLTAARVLRPRHVHERAQGERAP